VAQDLVLEKNVLKKQTEELQNVTRDVMTAGEHKIV